MIKVASLLGVSYSGKSTLAEGVVNRLAANGVGADVIKKDAALRVLGREKYGDDDKSGGYSITGFLRQGGIPPQELHAWMNQEVRASLSLGRVVILEGGTRTRAAQAETLQGIELAEDDFRIFMLQLPFKDVLHRARLRRRQQGRYDDTLLVAAAKLYGQYQGMHSDNAPQPGDPDVIPLDARLAPHELIEITAGEILLPTEHQ